MRLPGQAAQTDQNGVQVLLLKQIHRLKRLVLSDAQLRRVLGEQLNVLHTLERKFRLLDLLLRYCVGRIERVDQFTCSTGWFG